MSESHRGHRCSTRRDEKWGEIQQPVGAKTTLRLQIGAGLVHRCIAGLWSPGRIWGLLWESYGSRGRDWGQAGAQSPWQHRVCISPRQDHPCTGTCVGWPGTRMGPPGDAEHSPAHRSQGRTEASLTLMLQSRWVSPSPVETCKVKRTVTILLPTPKASMTANAKPTCSPGLVFGWVFSSWVYPGCTHRFQPHPSSQAHCSAHTSGGTSHQRPTPGTCHLMMLSRS